MHSYTVKPTYTHKHTNSHILTYKYTHIHTHTYKHTDTHISYTYKYTFPQTHAYIHSYTYINIHIHIYTFTHTNRHIQIYQLIIGKVNKHFPPKKYVQKIIKLKKFDKSVFLYTYTHVPAQKFTNTHKYSDSSIHTSHVQ